MCRDYDAGQCVEPGCTGRITCRNFNDDRCAEHSINGVNASFLDDDEEPGSSPPLIGDVG
jgi:hypothetical protein